jgi:hypothetical protein
MQVYRIDDTHKFDQLRTDWDAAYAVDPNTTVFTSWSWLRGWIEGTSDNWTVLATRPDATSPYCAFLTLSMDDTRGRLSRGTLQIGGDPWADHAGFVCVPRYDRRAVEGFAEYVQRQLQWDRFHLRNVFDSRLDFFLSCFRRGYDVRQLDRLSCPYVPLPSTWDHYVEDYLSSSVRKNLRYYTRRIERLDDFHVTRVQADNLESQIETLLALWQSRWGLKPEHVLDLLRITFRRCFESNRLWLTILWKGTTPIAGLAAFVDRQRSTVSYWIGGYNDAFSKLSPGNVMVGYSIRYAIENRFRVYDFLRGDEPYKFSFGALERFNTNVTITRRSARLALSKLIGVLRKSLLCGLDGHKRIMSG